MLVQSFTSQVAQWWNVHGPRLQTWMTNMQYFFKRFRVKKLTTDAYTNKYKLGYDPTKHIEECEKEWRRIGYIDERVCPHLFPDTLTDLPHK